MKQILTAALVLIARLPAHGLTPNLPAGTVTGQLVINTSADPLYNAVRYAPLPVLPVGIVRATLPGRGVFAVVAELAIPAALGLHSNHPGESFFEAGNAQH